LGMLVVETIAKIRRAYFAQNKPIKTICREFRVSRRVVRKVIRSQATEFRYERSRQPLPRIDPWRDQLDGLLLENEGKPARERLTLIRIFEELRALGYEGSYTRFVDTPRGGVPPGQVFAIGPGGHDEATSLYRIEVTEGPGGGVRLPIWVSEQDLAADRQGGDGLVREVRRWSILSCAV
jgi:hypothetical protein